MSARVRKLFGLVGILAILGAWIWGASAIGGRLPQHPAVLVIYYAVAGLGWGLPVLPLIAWMNRGR